MDTRDLIGAPARATCHGPMKPFVERWPPARAPFARAPERRHWPEPRASLRDHGVCDGTLCAEVLCVRVCPHGGRSILARRLGSTRNVRLLFRHIPNACWHHNSIHVECLRVGVMHTEWVPVVHDHSAAFADATLVHAQDTLRDARAQDNPQHKALWLSDLWRNQNEGHTKKSRVVVVARRTLTSSGCDAQYKTTNTRRLVQAKQNT